MAEKFQKPKKFTKAWFGYIWHYYKVHFFVALAVVLLAVGTVYDVLNTVKYDIRLVYCSEEPYSEAFERGFPLMLENEISDVNGDGENHVLVSQLSFSYDVSGGTANFVAMEEKLLSLLASDDEMLFICDETVMKHILDLGMTEDAFIPVYEWGNEEISNSVGVDYAGDIYAANLKNSRILNDTEKDAQSLYIMVKMNLSSDDEENCARFEESKKLANKLVK